MKNLGRGRKCFSLCAACHNNLRKELFRDTKRKAVAYKGGKCQICGYDKYIGSMDFHHRDPKTKDPDWNILRSYKFDKLIVELDKCDLLCRNCHGEVHAADDGDLAQLG